MKTLLHFSLASVIRQLYTNPPLIFKPNVFVLAILFLLYIDNVLTSLPDRGPRCMRRPLPTRRPPHSQRCPQSYHRIPQRHNLLHQQLRTMHLPTSPILQHLSSGSPLPRTPKHTNKCKKPRPHKNRPNLRYPRRPQLHHRCCNKLHQKHLLSCLHSRSRTWQQLLTSRSQRCKHLR